MPAIAMSKRPASRSRASSGNSNGTKTTRHVERAGPGRSERDVVADQLAGVVEVGERHGIGVVADAQDPALLDALDGRAALRGRGGGQRLAAAQHGGVDAARDGGVERERAIADAGRAQKVSVHGVPAQAMAAKASAGKTSAATSRGTRSLSLP